MFWLSILWLLISCDSCFSFAFACDGSEWVQVLLRQMHFFRDWDTTTNSRRLLFFMIYLVPRGSCLNAKCFLIVVWTEGRDKLIVVDIVLCPFVYSFDMQLNQYWMNQTKFIQSMETHEEEEEETISLVIFVSFIGLSRVHLHNWLRQLSK